MIRATPRELKMATIQITGNADKNKAIQVRLTLSGVVARKLAQEKKTGGSL